MTAHAASRTQSAPIEDVAVALEEAIPVQGDLPHRLCTTLQYVGGRIAFSTSLGIEDQAILHAIASLPPAARHRIDVFTLDTGRLFPETLETIEESERKLGISIRVVAPVAEDVEALIARDGILGFRTSVDARKACCNVRKVLPLEKALMGAGGWITGLRRQQSAGRGEILFAEADGARRLIKVNPIADWTLERLESYVAEHDVPVNPLHARGFPSIGCQTCTRAIRPGEDQRAGRWWWENEDGKECGLHSPNRPALQRM